VDDVGLVGGGHGLGRRGEEEAEEEEEAKDKSPAADTDTNRQVLPRNFLKLTHCNRCSGRG
jgi:hypothetical protein